MDGSGIDRTDDGMPRDRARRSTVLVLPADGDMTTNYRRRDWIPGGMASGSEWELHLPETPGHVD